MKRQPPERALELERQAMARILRESREPEPSVRPSTAIIAMGIVGATVLWFLAIYLAR